MTRSPAKELTRLLLIVVIAGAAGGYLLTNNPFRALHPTHPRTTSPHTAQHRSASRTHLKRLPSTDSSRERQFDESSTGGARSSGGSMRQSTPAAWLLGCGQVALEALAIVALGLLGGCAVVVPARMKVRRRRAGERQRYEIIPYRNDVATPERMVQVFQALGATLNRRWFRRILGGAPSVALEIHVLPYPNRSARVVLSVVCTQEHALLVDSCLQIAYPDVRVGYEFTVDPHPAQDAPTWIHHVKRLKKLRPFITQVGGDPSGRIDRAFEHQLTDDLLVNLAQIQAPVTVQLTLTPVPRWVDRLARRAYREEEHLIAARRNAGELGDRSPVADAELRAGLVAQHQLLFYADIRCASSDAGVALLAAQSLSQGTGVNRLRVKEPWLLSSLHARRIGQGIPRLLPPVRHGVLSSRELALLWQLPSQRPKSVTVKRSNLLREPASSAVWRPTHPDDAFAVDERGPIGIRPKDRRLGVCFTGVPGVGKTSGMVSLWKSDARDRDAVMIGLDPKSEAAEEWLSQVPADRTVYFLDLARPEFGMSPLVMDASMEVIGDTVVESLRDINEDGAIMAASDRYLRSATYGALLLAAQEHRMPSWYDLYQQLWPETTGAELRQRVCELCEGNPDLAGLRAMWGTILPSLLKESPSQVAVRMDAPGNKLARLLNQPTLSRMLHHPVQVSIDQIINERAVLIVQGSMGEIGEENTVIALRLLMRELHTSLHRQQLKPAHLRARICTHIDEVHHVWGDLLEVMLSTGRSAGVEAVLAWQHAGQIEEARMAKGVLADLQTSIHFRCGDPDEAELVARQAMVSYVSRFSGEQADRDNARFTPDGPLKLSRFHAWMLPIVNGEKDKPVVIRIPPMRKDLERIEHHRQQQRNRGCFYPESMPDPLPNRRAQAKLDDGAIPRSLPRPRHEPPPPAANASPQAATAGDTRPHRLQPTPNGAASDLQPSSGPPDELPSAPSQTTNQGAPSEAMAATAGSVGEETPLVAPQAGAPVTFTEIDFGDVTQLIWDSRQAASPPERAPECKPDELRALMFLHAFGPLLTTQIGREIWPERSERTVQRRLEAMHRNGIVDRFHLATAVRHPYIYTLAPPGFQIAQETLNGDGRRHYLDPTAKFSTENDEVPDPVSLDATSSASDLATGLYALGNLHGAGWTLAAGALLGKAARRVHGSRESSCALRPPRGSQTHSDVAIRGNRSVGGLQLERFSPIWADARLDVQVPGHPMTHWYIECDRSVRPSTTAKKLAAYDAMFNAWGQELSGYQQRLPIAIFVCPDERSVLAHLAAADRQLTGWVAGLVGKLEDRCYLGRQRIWFAIEIDVHRGSLRAWRVPDLPPATRKTLGEPEKPRPIIKNLAPTNQPGSDNPPRHRATEAAAAG